MTLQPGDILAFYGTDWTSRCIEWGTWGPSHVGILCDYRGSPVLVESTTLCDQPCLVTGKTIRGVQAHLAEDRIATYRGRVLHYALTDECRLSSDESTLLTRILLKHWIGRPYDLAGALVSGTNFLKFSHWVPYPDLGSVFCSKLVARLYMRLNRLNWDDPGRYSPAYLIRTLRRTGVIEWPEVVRAGARACAA
jgi:hypothetical protein